MFHKKYGMNHVQEGPLAAVAGGLIGGLIGGGGTLAGMLTMGGMIGMGLGAVGGTLLGNAMSPQMPSFNMQQAQPSQQEVPRTPAAPASPVTPGAPGTTGEASPSTTADVAKGTMPKKRKGRVSTILTSPGDRDEGGEEVELLGG